MCIQMGKTHNYRLRIEPDLHQEFTEACQFEDRRASQVIREFMREYVKQHRLTRQDDLFATNPGQSEVKRG
ncbi:MAG: hypothetical protein ACPG4N_11495 [Gammaproteobacteria bacterium]